MKRFKYELLVIALAFARQVAGTRGMTRAVLLDAERASGYRVARELPVLRDGLVNSIIAKDGQVQGETYSVS